ncbi:MAG: carboxypeptidase-like regulatory domain-containing protein [Bacteroidota bacterium]|nr:carboxypeptidase-like regulatory domain-containing protein [Bacteroidota bacterium]
MNKVLSLFFLLFSTSIYSQSIIRGVVFDKESKETLIGANVVIENTTIGTTTNLNGKFRLATDKLPPIKISITYLGYETYVADIESLSKEMIIMLKPDNKNLDEITIVDDRLTQKQKEDPLTVESLDIIAIKETPAISFYDGLGNLKGVDITAASLGFKVINTRGFNSTSPVRSLQLIDGVDNQAPGLNFSLGNFLGASELDIKKVDIIQGASSAYYGPNAFNGVIKMSTLDPFLTPGLSAQFKVGERHLSENIIRYAHVFQNRKNEDRLALKINFSMLRANDWEANNMDPVYETDMPKNNLGGYDAVNRYGDEDIEGNINDVTENFGNNYFDYPGFGKVLRTGYLEKDIVDYNTENIKAAAALHYKLKPEIELITAFNYGTGTTVYQGDNRYSLKDIKLKQYRVEINQKDKFFVRFYRSEEDAGNSYDAVFTAFKMQECTGTLNTKWYSTYREKYRERFSWEDLNWESAVPVFDPSTGNTTWYFQGQEIDIYQWQTMSDSVLNANRDLLLTIHNDTRNETDNEENILIPGTQEFNDSLSSITSRIPLEGGTGFYDKSALNHLHAERQFKSSFGTLTIGGNFRKYQPNSKGSIFLDTNKRIINIERGGYIGLEKITEEDGKKFKLNMILRIDKNDNFDLNFSPALSIVYKPEEKKDGIFRLSFSSAIRNPTFSDQYLFYNTGRAILIGNLNGHGTNYGENLATISSVIKFLESDLLERNPNDLNFFSVDPIKPEKAKSIEIGYRTTIREKLYLDANYYYSQYDHFIGYKIGAKFNTVVSPPDTPFYFYDQSIQVYRMAANSENVVTTQGFSLGINYYLNNKYALNGNYSWNKLNEETTDDPIIPAYNTPENKFNIGFSGRNLNILSSFNINYKWVEGYQYEGSPQFTGYVPTYGLLDAQVSKKIPEIYATIKWGISNLLNNMHYEVYGGPYIGRMSYLSILFEFDKK